VHSHHPLPGRCGTIHLEANALQCIVSGEETPKTAPSPWDFVTLPEEDRATVISNMQKLVKIARVGSEDMLANRQTDRQTDRHTHTQTCSSQYFATAPNPRRRGNHRTFGDCGRVHAPSSAHPSLPFGFNMQAACANVIKFKSLGIVQPISGVRRQHSRLWIIINRFPVFLNRNSV